MRTATYCLVAIYLMAHLWTWWRIRTSPFFALRCLCLAMSVRAVLVLEWMASGSALRHWDAAWGLVQPIEILACWCVALELVYFVSTRILPGELRSLLYLLAISGAIAVIAALHSPTSASAGDWWKNVPGYLYVWLATFMSLLAVCLRIVKPVRFAPLISRHLTITAVYLWIWALSDIVYPAARQGSTAYQVVNFASLAGLSLCLFAWGILLPSAARRSQAA